MITLYPSADEVLKDPEAEQQVAILQETVSSIRTLKSTYNLKSGADTEFVVKSADPAVRSVVAAQKPLIEQLSRAKVADIVEEYPQTRGTIAHVVSGQTLYLLNAGALLDAPAEIARLGKETQKVEKEADSLKGRLNNADFVSRAKPEVVEQSRARVTELEARRAELEQHIAALKEI
jgi:valyl-tRNA synthetase